MIFDPAHAREEAMKLAALGVPVFPCLASKAPARPKIRGGQGYKDGTTDPVEVANLWRDFPGPLVGACTGEISGFDVLDFDTAKHPEVVRWFFENRNRLPRTRVHQTGSGGMHYFFKHDPLARTGNGRLGIGIDAKANGGYVIWWPAAGRKVINAAPIDAWPRWLIAKQQPEPPKEFHRPVGPTNFDGIADYVAALREGERNAGTFWAFCRAEEEGGPAEAINAITHAALRNGLSLAEIRQIAGSARRTIRSGKGTRHVG
jgi:hypothetical protein